MSGEFPDCFPAEPGISLPAMTFGLVFANSLSADEAIAPLNSMSTAKGLSKLDNF